MSNVAPSAETYLTVTEVAGILRKSEQTIRKMINDGRLAARKNGHNWLVTRREIDEYLNRQTMSQAELIREKLNIT